MDIAIVLWLAVIGTSVWVFADVREIAARERAVCGRALTSPGGWTAGCLVLWIGFFPLYLAKRRALLERTDDAIKQEAERANPLPVQDSFENW